MMFSKPASGDGCPSRSSTFAGGAMPAQFTTTRSGPAAAAVCTAAATCSGSVTSAGGERAAELVRDLGARRGRKVDDRDGGSGRSQAPGGRKAEPARAAGDEGGGAREVHGSPSNGRRASGIGPRAASHPTLRGTECQLRRGGPCRAAVSQLG